MHQFLQFFGPLKHMIQGLWFKIQEETKQGWREWRAPAGAESLDEVPERAPAGWTSVRTPNISDSVPENWRNCYSPFSAIIIKTQRCEIGFKPNPYKFILKSLHLLIKSI